MNRRLWISISLILADQDLDHSDGTNPHKLLITLLITNSSERLPHGKQGAATIRKVFRQGNYHKINKLTIYLESLIARAYLYHPFSIIRKFVLLVWCPKRFLTIDAAREARFSSVVNKRLVA